MKRTFRVIWVICLVVLLFLALSNKKTYVPTPKPKPTVEVVQPAPVLDKRPNTYKLGRIIDGDTFIAIDDKDNEIKVRMAGIDAPENKQVFGQDATDYLTVLLHEPFVLRIWDTDRYDREIATVLVHDQDINQIMVQDGFAWACSDYKSGPSYAEDQNTAREERRGLWNQKSTLPPWYFRKINGHGDFGYQLLKGGFYLWDGVMHNHNCPGKVNSSHSWNGVDPYENCPKCGGLVYD